MKGASMRLNLGCAKWKLPGWENVDLPEVDLSVFPWPWDDGSVSEILASHILEHFDRETGFRFLQECGRVLSPGCVLHIAVPDMDKFIDCWLLGDFSPLDGYAWTSLNYLMGGDGSERRQEWRHRYMYSYASLAWTLQNAGLAPHRQFLRLNIDNPKYSPISLYVDAYKNV